jgi:hypothetical protein
MNHVRNRAANVSIADAALALATTYDPRYLAQHNLIGIAGDETKARDWYQRASELGSTEAGRIRLANSAYHDPHIDRQNSRPVSRACCSMWCGICLPHPARKGATS